MDANRQTAKRIIWYTITGMLALILIYIYTYIFRPFSVFWSDLLTNSFGILAVGLCAAIATGIWTRYSRSEIHFSIWMCFALGLWFWFLGDLSWGIYNMALINVPKVSLADLFYLMGYVMFPIALHRQYRILYRPSFRRDTLVTGGIAAATLLSSLFFTMLLAGFQMNDLELSTFLNVLYPTADLVIALISFVFVVNFGRGALARPWIGLIFFTITDSLYAWLFESNTYAFSVVNANLPSLIADCLYAAAYLLMAVLLLSHYLLLKYGPSIIAKAQG